MNIPIAIPAHVGEDGVWIQFISPVSGVQCGIHLAKLIEGQSGPVARALTEWGKEQERVYALHNPGPVSA